MPFDPVSYAMGAKSAGGGGGGSSTLAGLTDVDISNPTDGQTLVYNATSGKWVNGAGGSGASVLVLHGDRQTTALDKTAKEILDAVDAGKSIVFDNIMDGGKEHQYGLFIGYYLSPDEWYEFDFVKFNQSGTGEYAGFGTDTENGYPVFLIPSP